MEVELSTPRQDNTSEATPKDGTVVTIIIRSDDDLPDPSGTTRRQNLSLRRNELIVTQELSSSSDSASESENEEVASNDLDDQESVDPTQIAQNSEGDMDSSVAVTQVCGATL